MIAEFTFSEIMIAASVATAFILVLIYRKKIANLFREIVGVRVDRKEAGYIVGILLVIAMWAGESFGAEYSHDMYLLVATLTVGSRYLAAKENIKCHAQPPKE